jgi:UDP-N-acetylmuramoylalanine--D-glutamate ligase
MNIPGRALVIGYGLSGRAAAYWLASQGSEVVVLEDDPEVARGAQVSVKARGLSVQIGRGPERAEKLACSADLVVPSPGVPLSHPALVAAKAFGVDVLSEIELAWRVLDAMGGPGERPGLVAITGTNGKTTVTKLVVAMLAASGKEAVAAGNVGYPLLEAVSQISPNSEAVLVAEVSSFQLEYTRKFRPDVSCWLNFAPDHLDWHPDLEHYARAKVHGASGGRQNPCGGRSHLLRCRAARARVACEPRRDRGAIWFLPGGGGPAKGAAPRSCEHGGSSCGGLGWRCKP